MSDKMPALLKRSIFAGLLFFTVNSPAQAVWEFPGLSADTLQPDALDRAFECELTGLMDAYAGQLEGVKAVATRFANTIVITGYARNEAGRVACCTGKGGAAGRRRG